MLPNLHYSLKEARRIATAKERSHQLLMEHTQPLQSMNTKTSRNVQPTFVLGDTPNLSSIGSTLPKEVVSNPLQHPL